MIIQEKVKEEVKKIPVALIDEQWSEFEKAIDWNQKIPNGFKEIGRGMLWKHDIRANQSKCPKIMQIFLRKA